VEAGPKITLYPLMTPFAATSGGELQDTRIDWEVRVVQEKSWEDHENKNQLDHFFFKIQEINPNRFGTCGACSGFPSAVCCVTSFDMGPYKKSNRY